MGELLTADELAERLKVSPDQVYRFVKRGMPCKRLGKTRNARLRFDADEVLAWITACASEQARRRHLEG